MTNSGAPSNVYAQPRLPLGRRPRPADPRATRQPQDIGYQVLDPQAFELHKFAAPDNLYQAFQQLEEHGGHGAGIDGFRPLHFSEHELRPILRKVSQSIINGSYDPHPVRIVEIPKSATKVRTLALLTFADRAVAKALLNCLSGFWQQQCVTRSVWQIYAALDREIRQRKVYTVAIDDIRDCFPSAPLESVMHWHRHHISQPGLLQVIERVIRVHDGPDQQVGLGQGSPYSPTAMEVLLHHTLDTALEARSGNTSLFRYVDNLTFLGGDVSECNRALTITREVTAEAGFALKGEDGEPQDIRDPQFDTVILGLIPQWQNGLLTFSIPERVYRDLEEGLLVANGAVRPADSAKRRCFGWLQALGPALTKSVERGVVGCVVDMACRAGFRSVTIQELLRVTESARTSWHRVLRGAR